MGWAVGGRFKREGIYVYLWLIHVDVWKKPIQYCKPIIPLLKVNTLKIIVKALEWGDNPHFGFLQFFTFKVFTIIHIYKISFFKNSMRLEAITKLDDLLICLNFDSIMIKCCDRNTWFALRRGKQKYHSAKHSV